MSDTANHGKPDQQQLAASGYMRDEIMQIIRRYDLTVLQTIGVLELVKFELLDVLPRFPPET